MNFLGILASWGISQNIFYKNFLYYNLCMTMKGAYTCIFGGGAVRGIAYVGAIKALKQLNFNVKTLVGSSVGSIIASLLAVGYSEDEINDILMDVNFELFRDIHFGLNKDFALSKGNVFTEWIRDAIEKKVYGLDYKKGCNKPVTFADIKRNLIILTTDLNNFKSEEFSTFETPDFEIATAVRISCSMPGLMTPVEIDGKRLVDGDVLKGIPLWKLSKNIDVPDNRVLEFRLEGDTVQKTGNTFEFLNSIYSCMTSASTDFIMDVFGENDKYDYVKITTGNIIVIDFNMSKETRESIVNMGYNDSIKYLTEDCVSKKMQIANIYLKMIDYIEDIIKALKYASVKDTLEVLKELFMYMSDYYKYIDANIFECLWTLKNDILTSPKRRFLFGSEKFKNKESLIDRSDIINKVIKEKHDELIDYNENVG